MMPKQAPADERPGGGPDPESYAATRAAMAVVAEALAARGMSWDALAEASGIFKSNFTKYRNVEPGKERKHLRWADAVRISDVLGISLDAMAGRRPPEPGRSEDEARLLRYAFGGPKPLGLDRVLHLVRLGLESEGGPPTAPDPAPEYRPVPPPAPLPVVGRKVTPRAKKRGR